MQYTHPDIMYAVNRLSIHDSAPSVPDLQGINHLIRYLYGSQHHPIMYFVGFGVTTNHEIRQELFPGDFYSKNIANGLVDTSYGGEGYAPDDKHSLSYIIICLFSVAVNWSSKTQPVYAAH